MIVIRPLPGDLFFVQGTGPVSDVIQAVQGSPLSHCFLWVGAKPGDPALVQSNGDPLRSDLPYSAQRRNIVSADADGVNRTSVLYYCDELARGAKVAIYRLRPLTPQQRDYIAAYALECVGHPYGYLADTEVVLDKLVSLALGSERDWFRRLSLGSTVPNCSILCAESYKIGAGYIWPNRTPAGSQTPATLYPACQADPPWECLKPLGPLSAKELVL